jgi:hypothetical protein
MTIMDGHWQPGQGEKNTVAVRGEELGFFLVSEANIAYFKSYGSLSTYVVVILRERAVSSL